MILLLSSLIMFIAPNKKGKKREFRDFFIIFHKNIYNDLSVEPSHTDSSNEGSQHMFSLRNKKNYHDLS